MNLGDRGEERGFSLAGLVMLVPIAALLIWWGLGSGGYFSTTFYPGELGLLGLLAVFLIGVPLRTRPRGSVLVALAALIALGGWMLLSILWTPPQESALVDAHKIVIYVTLFVLGAWIASLLGERRDLALLAVGVAGTVVAVVAAIRIGTGTEPLTFLEADGTLRFPIGYRNANAAFWLMSVWPLLALAVRGELVWWLRALMLAAVTMLVELAVLCQSRGSIPAAAIALVAIVLISRKGLKTGAFVVLAAIPAIPALPTLLDVYSHGNADAGSIPLLHHAAIAIALSTLGSAILALLVLGLVEGRVELGARTTRRLSLLAGAAVIVVAVAAAGVVVGHAGGPSKFLDARLDELREERSNLGHQGARFGVDISSHRTDTWRVALDQWSEDPIRGGGAGSFHDAYLQKKHAYTPAEDPHSVELLMLGEFGLVGFVLFVVFLGGATVAAWRSRRLGPTSVTLVAGVLALALQWLLQASYDWIFFYPGVTAAAMFLLGAAAAPAVSAGGRLRTAPLLASLGAVIVVALGAAALFLSARYTEHAANGWRTDLAGAYADFDRAADLDPFAVEPLLSKGAVAREVGEVPVAIKSFEEAIDRQPDNFSAHYLLGLTLTPEQPQAALREFEVVHRLDPGFFLALAVRCAKAQGRGPAATRDACRVG